MQNDRPLSGYRVVELSTFMAAPSCGRLMADWGAEVIKVEANAGDPWRYFGPTMLMPNKEDENPGWELYNANKRGIALNLKTAEGQKIMHELLETADVFLTNNRVEALENLKLDYDSLKEKYPRLIYALVTGFGEKGPDVNLPGFDIVAFWSRSGFLVDLVQPDAYPVYSPAGFGDLTVGNTLFGGICAALLNRGKTGKGDKISVSLYGAAIWFLGVMLTSAQERYGNKFPKARFEGNPVAIPYKCKDNEWITLSILEYERYWPALCKALDREDLIDDERFNKRASMLNHRSELIHILEETFKAKDSSEWVTRLREADIVHDKMRHFAEVLNDAQAWANNYLHDFTFANGEKGILPCPPIQSAELGALPYERGPLLGEHTTEILQSLGYSSEQIEKMKNDKSIKLR